MNLRVRVPYHGRNKRKDESSCSKDEGENESSFSQEEKKDTCIGKVDENIDEKNFSEEKQTL